jgi:hypothetical protein
MTKLQEIEARIREENQDNCDMTETEIITEIAQEYARECIMATLKRIAHEDSYHICDEDGNNLLVVEADDIISESNIVLL